MKNKKMLNKKMKTINQIAMIKIYLMFQKLEIVFSQKILPA